MVSTASEKHTERTDTARRIQRIQRIPRGNSLRRLMLSWMSHSYKQVHFHLIGWSSCIMLHWTLRTCCTDCSQGGTLAIASRRWTKRKKFNTWPVLSDLSHQLFASCWYQRHPHPDHCSMSVPIQTLFIEGLLFIWSEGCQVSEDYQERKQDCQQSPATGTRLQESK